MQVLKLPLTRTTILIKISNHSKPVNNLLKISCINIPRSVVVAVIIW